MLKHPTAPTTQGLRTVGVTYCPKWLVEQAQEWKLLVANQIGRSDSGDKLGHLAFDRFLVKRRPPFSMRITILDRDGQVGRVPNVVSDKS